MLYFNKQEFLKRFGQAKQAIETSRGPGKWNVQPEAIEFTELIPKLQSYEVKADTDEVRTLIF